MTIDPVMLLGAWFLVSVGASVAWALIVARPSERGWWEDKT